MFISMRICTFYISYQSIFFNASNIDCMYLSFLTVDSQYDSHSQPGYYFYYCMQFDIWLLRANYKKCQLPWCYIDVNGSRKERARSERHVNSLKPSDAYICIRKLIIIGSDNGLPSGRRQANIWTNPGILLIGPLGTNVSEILIEIPTFSSKRPLKIYAKWRLFCLGFNVLTRFCRI